MVEVKSETFARLTSSRPRYHGIGWTRRGRP